MTKPKRKRGVILTPEGLQKLLEARLKSEQEENEGVRYTLEQLSERTGLDLHTIKRVLAGEEGVDLRTLERLYISFNLKLTNSFYTTPNPNKRQDWGEAICTSRFYGRIKELETLEKWLIQDRCRLVTILGIGGVGKTCLSVKLAEQIQNQFDCIIWRSLRDAPPLHCILNDLIQFLSSEQDSITDIADSPKEQITRLIKWLRASRCLVVLDNLESLLQDKTRAGQYRDNYQEYANLLKRVGESDHQSCVLLTTREKTREIASLEGEVMPVRTLRLRGVKNEEGTEILKAKGVQGSESQFAQLTKRYAGNALALKVVATTIQDLFGGNISLFLQEDTAIFGDLRDLLEQHFARLSDLEKQIMCWLAINREPVSLSQLREDMIFTRSSQILLEELESLSRRELIERQGECFTLQPVVMEYATSFLIEQVSKEIANQEKFQFFRCHALMKAQAKDYIRESQIRLIVQPLIAELFRFFSCQQDIESHLNKILAALREKSPLEMGYTAGNILNLFCQMGTDLTGYDFSYLTIVQADLRYKQLHNTNFTNADVTKTVFAESLGGIHSLAFSPDGNFLVIGDTNNDIYLYSIKEERHKFIYKEHFGWIWSLKFSPKGNLFASSSVDKTIKLWDVETGKSIQTLQGHKGGVWSIAFNSDGCLLASSSEDKTVRLWDVNTGQCLKIFKQDDTQSLGVAFSPNNQILASSNESGKIHLWDISAGQYLATLQDNFHRVECIAFSSDGQKLASGSSDKTVKIWDLTTKECLFTLQGHTDIIISVSFSPNQKILASSGEDKTVKLWDINTGRCVKTLEGHETRVWIVDFSPDGKILASGSDDQTVKLWDLSKNQCFKTLRGWSNGVWSIAFSPDGHKLVSGSNDRTLSLWDITTGQCRKMWHGHNHRVTSVAFSPNNRILASSSEDQTIKIWDVQTLQYIKSLQGHTHRVWSITFSPDGRTLASGSQEQVVRLWDITTGQCFKNLQGHTHRIWSVAFSPDGRILASGSHDQTIRLWDINTGQCLKILDEHQDWIWSVIFSPDGRILASSSSDQTMKIWDVFTGQCLKTLQGHSHCVYSIAISRDNQTLISGSGDQLIKLWDINTGICLKTLPKQPKWIWAVRLSPDGQTFSTACEDGTIKLWDMQTGDCLKTMKSPKFYEKMKINGIRGITSATINTLKTLGALEE